MKKRALKPTLALLLVIVLFYSLPMSALAYNGSAAITYADTYAKNPNSTYRVFGGDCTNFVSQCLKAGGMTMNNTWFYYAPGLISGVGYSPAWAEANSLKNYLKNDIGAKRLVSKWTNDGRGKSYKYINDSSNLSGDGREVVFYDWTDDGDIDHASICVGTGYDQETFLPTHLYYGDLIDQHTTNRKRTLWHLDEWNADYATTAIYAFRV